MIGLIGGILGVVGIAASALVYFRMGMAKTTIELLEKNNSTLNDRVGILEHEGREKDKHIAKCDGKIAALESERTTLRDLVTGRSAVENLAQLLDVEFKEIKSLLVKLTDERRQT